MKKMILSWGIAALALMYFAPAVRAQKKTAKPAISNSGLPGWSNQQYLNVNLDSSTNPPQMIATLKSDALYNMIISQGKLMSLYINGKPVPADSLYLYDALASRIVEQMRRDSMQAERDKEQAVRDSEQALRDKKQAERDALQAMRDKEQAELDRGHADMDRAQAERDRAQAVQDKKQAMNNAQQTAKDKIQAERDARQAYRDKVQSEREAIDAKSEAERDIQQAMRDREQAVRDKKQAERDAEQAFRDREQAERDRKQAEEDRMLLKGLLGDAVKEGLATDEKSIKSLILDDSVFFVNGKKQSDEMHKKFKEKYIKKEGYSYYINNHIMQVGVRN